MCSSIQLLSVQLFKEDLALANDLGAVGSQKPMLQVCSVQKCMVDILL